MGVRGLMAVLKGRGSRWELREQSSAHRLSEVDSHGASGGRVQSESAARGNVATADDVATSAGAAASPIVGTAESSPRVRQQVAVDLKRVVVIDGNALAHWIAAKRPPVDFNGDVNYYNAKRMASAPGHERQTNGQSRANLMSDFASRCTCSLLLRNQIGQRAGRSEPWPEWALGHDFAFMAVLVRSLVAAFCVVGGFEMQCVFDGGTPAYKGPTRRQRHADRLGESQKVWSAACELRETCFRRRSSCGRSAGPCSSSSFGNTKAHSVSPLFVVALRSVLASYQRVGVRVYQAHEEADMLVALLARGSNASVVLSDDSDFLTTDLGPTNAYVPLSSLVFGSCPEHDACAIGGVVAVGESFGCDLITNVLFGTAQNGAHKWLSPILSAAAGNDQSLPKEEGRAVTKLRSRILEAVRDGIQAGYHIRSGRDLTVHLARGLSSLFPKLLTQFAVCEDNEARDVRWYASCAASALGLKACHCAQCCTCEIIQMLEFSYSFCLFPTQKWNAASQLSTETSTLWLSACAHEIASVLTRPKHDSAECVMPCIVERGRGRKAKRSGMSIYSACLPLWEKMAMLIRSRGTARQETESMQLTLLCSNFNHSQAFTLPLACEVRHPRDTCVMSTICQMPIDRLQEFNECERLSAVIMRLAAISSTAEKVLLTETQVDAAALCLASATRGRCSACMVLVRAGAGSVCLNRHVPDAIFLASTIAMLGAAVIDLGILCCTRSSGTHGFSISLQNLFGTQEASWTWSTKDSLLAFAYASAGQKPFEIRSREYLARLSMCSDCTESTVKFAACLRDLGCSSHSQNTAASSPNTAEHRGTSVSVASVPRTAFRAQGNTYADKTNPFFALTSDS